MAHAPAAAREWPRSPGPARCPARRRPEPWYQQALATNNASLIASTGGCVDNDQVKLRPQFIDQRLQVGTFDQAGMGILRRPRRDNPQGKPLVGPQSQRHFDGSVQHLYNAGGIVEFHQPRGFGVMQIEIHQHSANAGRSRRNGKACGDGGLSFALHGGGDLDYLVCAAPSPASGLDARA